MVRRLLAELVGTALLVFFAVGVATVLFGVGNGEGGVFAAVVATSLAFGLVLMALAYTLGPVSGCHVNPAVTLGFLLTRRMPAAEAGAYVLAQTVGGIVGALTLWGVLSRADTYERAGAGLGADGYGEASLVGLDAGGAFLAEVVMTALFVFVVLAVTRNTAAPAVAGVVIGLTLTAVHLFGIPLTGTSVNPARSLGPALVAGGDALSQVWVFLLAPLLGGAVAAAAYRGLYDADDEASARIDVADEPLQAV